jgi:hypothetical protein
LTLGLYAQASSEAHRDAADRVGARFLRGARDGRGMELTTSPDADARTVTDMR